jgi:hypothetical protein
MSIVIRNGNRLALTNLEQLKLVADKIENGEPLMVRAVARGVVEECVAWDQAATGQSESASYPGTAAADRSPARRGP